MWSDRMYRNMGEIHVEITLIVFHRIDGRRKSVIGNDRSTDDERPINCVYLCKNSMIQKYCQFSKATNECDARTDSPIGRRILGTQIHWLIQLDLINRHIHSGSHSLWGLCTLTSEWLFVCGRSFWIFDCDVSHTRSMRPIRDSFDWRTAINTRLWITSDSDINYWHVEHGRQTIIVPTRRICFYRFWLWQTFT